MTTPDPTTKPGWEGCAWRLVRVWNPEAIGAQWLAQERLRNTDSTDCARAFADVIASATMGFGRNMTDTQEAIMGKYGVLHWYQTQLQEKVNTYRRTAHGIILPNGGG